MKFSGKSLIALVGASVVVVAIVFLVKTRFQKVEVSHETPVSNSTPAQKHVEEKVQEPEKQKTDAIQALQSEKREAVSEPKTTPMREAASQPMEKAPPVKKEEDGCYTITFHHKKISTHSDGEVCLSHSNLINLTGKAHTELAKKINGSSVCASINGSPVAFTKVPNKANEIMIGPIAGPHSIISVRFCTGKKSCSEKCIVKKDEFMSALGVEDSDGESNSGWEGTKEVAKEDSDLDSEVSALDQESAESRKKASIFDGWIEEGFINGCK